MTTYNAYVFYNGETATIVEHPVLQNVAADIDGLTIEQVREVFAYFIGEYTDAEQIKGHESWSAARIAQAMWDVHTLMFDTCAIISSEHATLISKMGDVLSQQFGGDSSTYAACEAFNTLLLELAVKTIPFPEADSDRWYLDVD